MIKNVVILGATGTLGRALLPALLEAGFDITIVTRQNSTHTDIVQPRVTVKEASYGDLSALTSAFKDQDALIEAFNPAAATDQRTIIRAALSAGIRHIITPDFSSDTFNPHADELLIFAPKKAAQKELESLVATSEGRMSWTAIIVGAWYDWGIENNVFWINKNEKSITRFGSGEQRYTITRLGRISEFVVKVLKEPSKFRNRPAYFASHTVTTNQLIGLVRDATGEEWEVKDMALDGLVEKGRQMWKEDTELGIKNRVATYAYAMLGTAAMFHEENRYGGDFSEKLEIGWEESEDDLRENLRKLLHDGDA